MFNIGTIVAFPAYLVQLHGPISAPVNVRVGFATSMLSFERVFEVLDLPIEIADRPRAIDLRDVKGHVGFESVSFSYLELGSMVRPQLGGAGAPPDARRGFRGFGKRQSPATTGWTRVARGA